MIEHWSFIWVKMIIGTSSRNQDGRRVQRNLGLKVFAVCTKTIETARLLADFPDDLLAKLPG